MENRSVKLLGIIFVLFIVMACSVIGSGPEEESVSIEEPTVSAEGSVTDEPEEELPDAGSGLCSNAYYPVVNGGTWSYKGTSSAVEDYSFTNTITSVRDDGFTVTVEFDELTLEQEWMCTPDGILALNAGGGPAGTLAMADVNLEIETQNASGITYPVEISAGKAWTHTMEYMGTVDMAGESVEVNGNTEYSYSAIGVESVSVPAGTFEAIKIEVLTTININMTIQGSEVPVTVTSTSTSWYAEGVGWVKSDSTSDVLGTTSTETIELVSYSIP